MGHARTDIKKVWGGSISRILFRIDRAYGGDHVSTAYVTISFQRPTREPWPGRPLPNVTDSSSQAAFAVRKPIGPFGSSSYLVLLRVMLTLPSTSPWTRWALTPPFHPYPGTIRRSSRGGLFSVALMSDCSAWALPSTLPFGVRTFLSPARCMLGERPPDPRPHTREL